MDELDRKEQKYRALEAAGVEKTALGD